MRAACLFVHPYGDHVRDADEQVDEIPVVPVAGRTWPAGITARLRLSTEQATSKVFTPARVRF